MRGRELFRDEGRSLDVLYHRLTEGLGVLWARLVRRGIGGQRKRGAGVWYERMRMRMVGRLLLMLLDRLQWVGGSPARC